VQKVQDKIKFIQESLPVEEFENFQKGELDLNKQYSENRFDFDMDRGFSGDEGEDVPERNIFKKGARFIQTQYE